MRILITGALGQLGRALQMALSGHDLALVDLPEVDITQRQSITTVVNQFQPQTVIHCAAFTDVDGSVANPDLANKVNALGTQNVALACAGIGAAMVHLSTNEVFAGDQPGGYEEWEPIHPINPYGRSKAAGEVHVRNILQRYYIVRTAWLYAPGGHNFIHSVLNYARQNGQLRVVTDEIGNPTYSQDLAQAIAQLIQTEQFGIYHLVNQGACSRFEFAQKVLSLAGLKNIRLTPILSSEFTRASTPPPYGALNNVAGASIGITLRAWDDALAEYITEYVL